MRRVRRVGADELGAHLVAGGRRGWRDAGEHRRLGDLHDGATLVLVDDDAVEDLALPARQQHRLGEVDAPRDSTRLARSS